MTQTLSVRLFFLPFMALILACGGNDMPDDFQQNSPVGFQLTKVTEKFPAVDEAYDSVDAHRFNILLDRVVEADEKEFEIAQYATADILGDAQAPVGRIVRDDTAGLLKRLIDEGDRHLGKSGVDAFYSLDDRHLDGKYYTKNFYAFLDRFSGAGLEPPEDYLSGLLYKVADQTLLRLERYQDNHRRPGDYTWLNSEIASIVEDLQDPKFKDDFTDFAKLLTKLLIQTDYPMWVPEDPANPGHPDWTEAPHNAAEIDVSSDINLDLGNAARGTSDLIQWLNALIYNPDTRELVHDMLLGFASVLDPSIGDELATKLRTLVENMESYFTVGGLAYRTNPAYSENTLDATHGHEVYSDAELGQTIREMAPFIQQLFLRSDRPQSMIASKIDETTKEPLPPVYPLDLMNKNLRSIGFNPDTIDIEGSLDDLIRLDIRGRDRVNDPEAWPFSHLETLLFLTQVTANFGWKDAGLDIDQEEGQGGEDSRDTHYHGEYAEGLTLNDALFSMHALLMGGVGAYEMALDPPDVVPGNNLYRSRSPFILGDVNDLNDGDVVDDSDDAARDGNDKDYRFFYNQDYYVLQFLTGPCPGDMGAPDGGNPGGQSLGMNQFRAYAPNGLHETQLAAATMGWAVRATFGGEGPYYYADPDAEIVTVNGQPHYKYLRPDGRIYAYVSLDHSQYLYPVDEGDAPDNDPEIPLIGDEPQRDNRFKAKWHSDYYISHFNDFLRNNEDRYFTVDNSSGRTEVRELTDMSEGAGRLEYTELIAEAEPMRACASAEEALFRNYQWVMNEKKMVLVIPMLVNNSGMVGVVWEVEETNGWAGLGNLRPFRDNHHEWAKQGTDGTGAQGNSTIPGDYRFEVVAAPSGYIDKENPGLFFTAISGEAMYARILDGGTATPAVIGHNMPALYRLAFPRSPEMDRGNGISDQLLGSREFNVGDDNWEHRNALVPILYSLLAGLREYTPAYDPDARTPGVNAGMRAFLNQTAILLKPLFYYNREEVGNPGQKPPPESWIPRVYGIFDTDGDGVDDRPNRDYFHQGAPFLTSAADFYAVDKVYTMDPKDDSDDITVSDKGVAPNYYGSEAEQRFFSPKVMKTILNVLIDSDITARNDFANHRCNGLLPLITRSGAKPLTRLFKLFLDSDFTAPPLEQIFTAIKFTKEPFTEINEGIAIKGMDFPEWMFVTGDEYLPRDDYGAYTGYSGGREDDIILDDILDLVIGHDAVVYGDTLITNDFVTGSDGNPLKGYGLANYPQKQARLDLDANASRQPWERFNDYVFTAADLLHESSPYCISRNLLDVIDRTFVRDERYTPEEVAGFMYAVGKLFGYYDTTLGDWVYQGQSDEITELYNLLAERVPEINSVVVQNEIEGVSSQQLTPAENAEGWYGWGQHYYAQLNFARAAADAGGLVEYLINSMNTGEYGWEETLKDLHRFVKQDDIALEQAEFWPTLAKLLRDLGKAVGQTEDGAVGDILTEYGFQVN